MATRLATARTSPDPQASPAPWWRTAVVYQVYLRSFADGNGDGIGDLAGLRSRLPYLSWLGVDALWINPHYPSGGTDGGYDITDYRAVDPDYGDVADLEALVSDARKLGLRVVLDVVPNHTSDRHPWFQAALADPDCAEAGRYHFAPPSEEPPNNWRSLFGGPAWSRTPDGRWYLHLFAPEQPDLNWRDPAVAADFEKTLRFWLDRGVSGFRVDVAYGLFKDARLRDNPGAYSPTLFGHGPEQAMTWNQPEVHDVWRRWRSICDEYPDTMLVGEVCLADLDEVALYSRPDELHQSLSFRLLKSPWSAESFAEGVQSALDAFGPVGAPVSWVLGNHDKDRLVTRLGDGAAGTARARAAALLMLALPGSAYVYAGDELALPQAEVPDEANATRSSSAATAPAPVATGAASRFRGTPRRAWGSPPAGRPSHGCRSLPGGGATPSPGRPGTTDRRCTCTAGRWPCGRTTRRSAPATPRSTGAATSSPCAAPPRDGPCGASSTWAPRPSWSARRAPSCWRPQPTCTPPAEPSPCRRTPPSGSPRTVARSGFADDLARVEQVERVESLLDGPLHGLRTGVQFLPHAVPLEQADAVFPAHRPAPGEGRGEDLLEGGDRGKARLVVTGRRDDQRVQVAVAGLRDGRDLHPVSPRAVLGVPEHRRHRRARPADALGQRGPEPLERRVGQPPGSEQRLGLDVVAGLLGPDRPGGAERRGHRRGLLGSRRARGVDLREQESSRVGLQAEVLPVLDRLQGGPVEQFQRDRGEPPASAQRHRLAGVDERPEGTDDGPGRADRRGAQPQRHLGDDPEGALRTDHEAGQVVAGHPLRGAPAHAHGRAVVPGRAADNRLQAEHVVAGDPVFEAAQATGVRGDIAADRGPRRAGRVGRVPEAVLGDRGLQVVVHHSGFHHRDQVVGVDLEDAVHPRQVEHEAAVDGVGPAGQSGSRTPGHDRHRQLGARTDDLLHLTHAPGADADLGTADLGPLRLVVAEARQDGVVGDQRAVREDAGQCGQRVGRRRRHRASLRSGLFLRRYDGAGVPAPRPEDASSGRRCRLPR